ncbi:MAG: hypothetical protein GW769_00195 [Alphaproteobacteria bacterium]|nr:hypothetical protein [Alphaproteobacteria bacterium]
MTGKSQRNSQQRILDKIVGDPPLIAKHQEIGSLMDAFAGAVTAFETPDMPARILKISYDALTQRVAQSKQPNAQACFTNFNAHYAKVISDITNPLASSDRDHRPRGTGTQRPLARGHR